MNKDKKQDALSFIKQMHDRKTAIKDIIKDKLSFIELFTRTFTWTNCPSSQSRLNFANLAATFWNHYKDINIDIVSMLRGHIALNSTNMDTHIDIVSMIKSHAWTKCLCSKF